MLRSVLTIPVFLIAFHTVVWVRAAPSEWEMRTSDAELLCGRGECARALVSAEQALKVVQDANGPEHPDVARCLNNLGVVRVMAGDRKEGREILKQAQALSDRTLGEFHPVSATVLENRSLSYKQGGRLSFLYSDAWESNRAEWNARSAGTVTLMESAR